MAHPKGTCDVCGLRDLLVNGLCIHCLSGDYSGTYGDEEGNATLARERVSVEILVVFPPPSEKEAN